MSDYADRAYRCITSEADAGLARVRRAPSLHSDGRCHFCEEPVPDGRLFCNADCRDDMEKHQAALQRAGR